MGQALDNIIKRLNSLGIYSITPEKSIYNEIYAYDGAFTDICKEADILLREIIVTTAEDYGLDMREKLWGVPRTDLTTDERRSTIEKRFCIGYNDFTLSAMYDFLESLGITAEITEVPEKCRMYIYVTNGVDFTVAMRKYLNSQILEFFPAHNEVYIDYRQGTWDTLDAKKTMFDTYDSFNISWDMLEHFE
ncbi:MAG: hypothetical protein UH239_02890 [Acutalibacteraceae bacterium]|nr:hypothetical protein [Acutalibacteraceae bacterium]